MIQFNFQKISQVPQNFFKKRKEISNYLKEIERVLREKDYSQPESFLLLPEATIVLKKPWQFYYNSFQLILLCGIGGSSLGAQAIYQALENKKDLKELLVLDSLNPLWLKKAILKVKKIKKGKVALLFISKSGKTLETIANFFVLFKAIKKYQPKVFVVSDENSPLWNFGKKNKFLTFSIPEKVEGRYSVFSNAGLLPLFLAGVKIKELISGARKANEICLRDELLKNPSLASSLTIFYHWKLRKNIYSNFIFPPDLEYFGRWYQQLMAESLGKEGKGITPTVAIGTSDFHSLIQLYLAGPKDKLINFVFVDNLDLDFSIPDLVDFSQIFPNLEREKIWQLNQALFGGLKRIYLKKRLAFTETILPKLDEENLGFLFQMKMIEIILLAKLMKVNAFNQPAVELYKKETRKILRKL